MDLAVLHHIPLLGLSLLFLSLPFSCFHNSFLFSLFRKEQGKGEIRERGSIKKSPPSSLCLVLSFLLLIHLSILVFALPVKNATLSMSPPPSLSLFKDKKHKKRKKQREWRPLAFLILFQWLGVGCLPVAPLHASAYASSRLISSVLLIVPKRKKKASSFHFHCSSFGFLFQRETNKREERGEG